MSIIDPPGCANNALRHILIFAPILPGKSEAWRRGVQSLPGSQAEAHRAARLRLRIRHERLWLLSGQPGDWALLALAVELPAAHVREWLAEADSFNRWLAGQLRVLHGIDLEQWAASGHAELVYAAADGPAES